VCVCVCVCELADVCSVERDYAVVMVFALVCVVWFDVALCFAVQFDCILVLVVWCLVYEMFVRCCVLLVYFVSWM
jgi:hypothetical protein